MTKKYNIQVDQDFIDAVAERLKNQGSHIESTYTVSQISKITKKNPATIRRHIKSKLLIAEQIGKSYLVKESDLQNYLKFKNINTYE